MNDDSSQQKQEGFNRKWIIFIGVIVVFILCLVPILSQLVFEKAALYYGSIFFVTLLGSSISLLSYIPSHIHNKAENRDFRVIHFMLRVAFSFSIGAVLIGILLIVFLIIVR
jgi:uncharacterized membrane protein